MPRWAAPTSPAASPGAGWHAYGRHVAQADQADAHERPAGPPRSTEGEGAVQPDRWAFVCHSSSCRYRGAESAGQALAREARDGGVPLTVVRAGCLGLCSSGPAVVTYPDGDVYLNVTAGDARELTSHVGQGRTLARRAIRVPDWYREHIVGRLGAYVQLLRRRASGG